MIGEWENICILGKGMTGEQRVKTELAENATFHERDFLAAEENTVSASDSYCCLIFSPDF